MTIAGRRLAIAFVAAGVASPALAIDCKLASSRMEKATCASPAALAADLQMAAAYGALHASLDAKQRAGLLKSQVAWLTARDGDCFDKKDAELGACLVEENNERRAFLSGAPQAGPGASGKIIPVFRIEAGGKGRTDVVLWRTMRDSGPAPT